MLSNIIEVGDKIELYERQIPTADEQNKMPRRIFKSKIYDITSETVIRIAMPIESGKVILLPVDGRYVMDFFAASGMYRSKGKIIERYKENNVYILVVELTTELEKLQRREYYRFNCSVEMDYFLLDEAELECSSLGEIEQAREEELKWMEGTIADISGGGARFISNVLHEKNSFLFCKFNLLVKHDIKVFYLKARLISSEKLLNKERKYENRIHFIDISKDDTEDIIHFIFEEERKFRKKEKS